MLSPLCPFHTIFPLSHSYSRTRSSSLGRFGIFVASCTSRVPLSVLLFQSLSGLVHWWLCRSRSVIFLPPQVILYRHTMQDIDIISNLQLPLWFLAAVPINGFGSSLPPIGPNLPLLCKGFALLWSLYTPLVLVLYLTFQWWSLGYWASGRV